MSRCGVLFILHDQNSSACSVPTAGGIAERRLNQPGACPGSARECMAETSQSASPGPGALTTWMAPPWLRTIPCTPDSPRPRPANLVVKNGSKILLLTSSVIPHPVSVTVNRTYSPFGRFGAPTGDEFLGPDVIKGNGDHSFLVVECFRCIGDQVHHHLPNLCRIGVHRGEAFREMRIQDGVLRDRNLEQLQHFLDEQGNARGSKCASSWPE